MKIGFRKRFSIFIIVVLPALLFFLMQASLPVYADGQKVRELRGYNGGELDDPDTTYVIYNRTSWVETAIHGNYLIVPEGSSREDKPITIILDRVQITQEAANPEKSWLTIEKNNHVIIKLRGDSYVKAWSHDEFGSDDGMAGIHVSKGSTVKVTSEEGDGKTSGSLEVHGGGGKYGGAGIGTRYNEDAGRIIIAGGTIKAYGGHSAAGIGSGRDGRATDIQITGGDIYAEGGHYGAGIGSGDHVGAGEGGDLDNLTISGGTIVAKGGNDAAGIGGSEGADIHGSILIKDGTITATGGTNSPGIGSGEGGSFLNKEYPIDIRGGQITAIGGKDGAGIGGGNGTEGGKVQISQTSGTPLTINATGGEYGSGIGTGDTSSKCEEIKIRLQGGQIVAKAGKHAPGIGALLDMGEIQIRGSGKIEAYGGSNGAGIGAGNDGEQSDPITIEGDTIADAASRYGARGQAPEGSRGLTITAMASYGRVEEGDGYSYENEAAAIGSGKATCADITVKNAVLVTKADCQGADIGGGGYHVTPGGTIKNIVIDNCQITSKSVHKVAPGIGSGYGGSVDHITITNTAFSGGGIGGAPMDFNYVGLNSVKSIEIDNCAISAKWDQTNPGKFVGGITPSTEPIEHGAAGIGAGQYGSMDTITIRDSKIEAYGFGSGSGIGSGGAGGNGFMVFDLEKWSIGDTGTIEISGSDVEAHSGTADFDPHSPVTFYDGDVWITIENPTMFGGGAGIGGGSASDTGTIDIHDCGKITAVGAGCGIGTGEGSGKIRKGAVDYIWLENIDEVYAKAGNACAGIGTGGAETGANWLDTNVGLLKQIYIKDCRDLKAYGGEGGAGIGSGSGCPASYHISPTEKGDWPLAIIDSKVYAVGGDTAAGIGAGYENPVTNKGGENPRTLIKGKSQVEAWGGGCSYNDTDKITKGGGAGIGGGGCGAGSVIEIDLTEDYDHSAKGTFEKPEDSLYYVKAIGGGGGAGIGSGGQTYQYRTASKDNADTETIIIKHGAVFARGSDSPAYLSDDDSCFMGAGAGIGGGSHGSNVKDISISGGYVMAEAGTPKGSADPSSARDRADDIGAGGNYSSDPGWGYQDGDLACGQLWISDGTVLCDFIGSFDEAKITGGSVSAIVKDATDGKSPVYKTTAKLPKALIHEKVDAFATSKSYGKKHLYTDETGRIYPYLTETGSETDHSQWADVEVNTEAAGKNNWHMVGYTDTDHTGLLKIEGATIPFEDPGPVRWGDAFTLTLADAEIPEGTQWDDFRAEGAASLKEVAEDQSPGVTLSMQADRAGDYKVTGSSDYNPDPECYWGSLASFTGTIDKAKPQIAFTNDPSKVYDAEPVTDPDVSSDSPGPISLEYYLDKNCNNPTGQAQGAAKEAGPPVHAGTYWVKATVAETDYYESASTVMDFTVEEATTSLGLVLSQNNAVGTATATVIGLYEADGQVEFIVQKEDETVPSFLVIPVKAVTVEDDQVLYQAVLTQDTVPEGRYTVKGVYHPEGEEEGTANYTGSEAEADGRKDLAVRTIEGTREWEKKYGDESFPLEMNVSEGDGMWDYKVIWDSCDLYDSQEFEAAVSVDDSGQVTVQHAGRSVIQVTCSDLNDTYYDATAYVFVEVTPAELKVTSYAFDKETGDPGENLDQEAVRGIAYGQVSRLDVGLKYEGFVHGDDLSTFSDRLLGSLAPVPLPVTAAASEEPYPIGIRRTGVPVDLNGTSRNLFFSRDYQIVEDTETYAVTVQKASLAVKANDAETVYGQEEPVWSWRLPENQADFNCDGLAPWDSKESVFAEGEEAAVILDPAIAGNTAFPDLASGTYENGLIFDENKGKSDNYELTWLPGSLTIHPASLADSDRFTVSVEDTVYNGMEQKQTVEITDLGSSISGQEASQTKLLQENTDYELIWPEDPDKTLYAGTVKVTVKGKGNYQDTREISYQIAPCPVKITTDDAEKLYDGSPLTAEGRMDGIPEADRDKLVLDVTGSRTQVGYSKNTWTLSYGEDGNQEKREKSYVVDAKTGILHVASNDLADFTLSQPRDCIYRGTEQKRSVEIQDTLGNQLEEGIDYSLTYSDETAAGQTSSKIIDAGSVTVTASGMGIYTGQKSVSYQIKPAPLHVDTKSAIKEYDKKPLTAGGDLHGLVNGETAVLQTTGSLTDPGSVPNTYETLWNGSAKESNYKVDKEEIGTLTVKPSEQGQNGIITEGYHGVYDGKEHVIRASALLEGSVLSYSMDGGRSWKKGFAKVKDASDQPIPVMIRAENADYVNGRAETTVQVMVTRAPLKVKTKSASKTYDGKPLTAGGSIKGFVAGEEASFRVTGKQTKVGSSPNRYQLKWNKTVKKSNYKLEENIGRLTVKSKKAKAGKKPLLLARAEIISGRSAVIKWNRILGADRYQVFFKACDGKTLTRKYKALDGRRQSLLLTGLKASRPYKFKILAQKKVNGKYKTICTSLNGHFVLLKNKTFTNPARITVGRSKIRMKAGTTYQIKAAIVKTNKNKYLLSKRHDPRLRYLTTNPELARVNGNGTIKARKKGKCLIYVQAVNGIYRKISLTVE